jgi:hypothetical protein
MLKQLVGTSEDYPDCFRFSVLQIVPKTMAREDVIRRETAFKNKLGTRAVGLNAREGRRD